MLCIDCCFYNVQKRIEYSIHFGAWKYRDDGSAKGSIDYVYDAAGNKLKKVVHESGKDDVTTVYGVGVYVNDTLQFLPQEEGRIRLLAGSNSPVYDYFL